VKNECMGNHDRINIPFPRLSPFVNFFDQRGEINYTFKGR
jgi:hypothetical protein